MLMSLCSLGQNGVSGAPGVSLWDGQWSLQLLGSLWTEPASSGLLGPLFGWVSVSGSSSVFLWNTLGSLGPLGPLRSFWWPGVSGNSEVFLWGGMGSLGTLSVPQRPPPGRDQKGPNPGQRWNPEALEIPVWPRERSHRCQKEH